MPVKYLKHINIILKNNLSLNYNIKKEMKTKSQDHIAKFLRDLIENNYFKIKSLDLRFDVPLLKKDMEEKTAKVLSKSFNN